MIPVGCADGSLWKSVNLFKTKTNNIPPIKSGDTFAYPNKDEALNLSNNFHISDPLGKTNYHNVFITKHVLHSDKKFLTSHTRAPTFYKHCAVLEIYNYIKQQKAVLLFTRIINSCLRIGYSPTKWNQAKVIPIHQPAKPSYLLNSYRPISLLNSFSKITEKVILKRYNKLVKINLANRSYLKANYE